MPIRQGPWPVGAPCGSELRVPDADAARAFYQELFGWDFRGDTGAVGGDAVAFLDGHPAARIASLASGDPGGPAWMTYFAVDDVDAAADDVVDADGSVRETPVDVAGGRRAIVADAIGASLGLWSPTDHAPTGVYGQHGAVCWNELHTRMYGAAQEFYGQVFGWVFQEIGDGESFVYSVFMPTGVTDAAGGVCDDAVMGVPPEVPSHWLTWFMVDDADAAAAAARSLGGTVTVEPRDSPFGRMVVAAGATGEMFGLIDPSTTSE